MTHPQPNRRFVPQAVLTKSGEINTAGASVNNVVRPVNIVGSKPTVNYLKPISNAYKKGYSLVTRPFNKYSEYKISIFNKKVNIVRVKDTTARDRAVQKEYKEKGVIDSGCSRHITGNKCYLTEYEDYDGGFASFGDGKGSKRLISWQCKKQTIDANSTIEAEYVAAANCCGQVLWIQNQMLDYGFNFMNTKIFIDNESTICIVKNPVFHSKTKHIEIRHHFIRDCYEKKLIQFWNNATSKTVNSVKQIHAIIDGKVVVISESSVRNDLSLMMRMVTALPQTSVPLDHGADEEIGSGDRPKRQDTTLGGADAQTRPETASKMSHDPPPFKFNTSRRGENSMEYHDDLTDFVPPTPHDSPLLGGNTPRSNEGRMELIQELMETCISLTKRVLSLEEAKTAQDRVITRLKLRVNRLEKKRKARTPQPIKRRLFKGRVETSTDKSLGEDASKQERNDDKTEELNLTDGVDTEVIREDKGSGERGGSTADQVSTVRLEVSAASVPVNVSAATPSTTPPIIITIFGDEDLTIAQTLVKMRRDKAKEKEKGVVLINEEEPPRLNRSTTTLQPLLTIDPKDKELAQRLHEEEFAELDRAQKERQKQEEATSVALAEEFDEIQARTDADHELAVRLTHEEQEKYTIKERARLLVEFFKRRKKQLAAIKERVEAIRNKPPTRTQIRNKMITYLKHMAESTKKRLRADSKEESSKKQKLEEDNDAEKEELKDSMDVVPRDDVAIDVESLATKYLIVD
ncbi:hypothetical protein Tco_1275414 [Tanacetum coccineum]